MKDNKLSVVALVIGLVALASVFFGIHSNAPESDKSVGATGSGTTYEQQDRYKNGLYLGGNNVTFTQSGTVPAGSNVARWTNRTGRTVYVPLTTVTTTGTASSTFAIYAYATSTTVSTLYDFTATPASADRMAISNFALATSSTATTTSSIEKAPAGKVISVPDGWNITFLLRAPAASCPSVGGSCESATSTNRGFNLNWGIQAYYQP